MMLCVIILMLIIFILNLMEVIYQLQWQRGRSLYKRNIITNLYEDVGVIIEL
jgi:hypothetical protein